MMSAAGRTLSVTDKVEVNETLADWLFSLKLMHRSHWDAARWYDGVNLLLGVGAAVCAAISGTSAFSANANNLVTGTFGLVAAILAAVQTSMRASELSAKHKHAGIRFGQLRRELEEQQIVGLHTLGAEQAKAWLTDFRVRWGSVDDESPPVPRRFYQRTKKSARK